MLDGTHNTKALRDMSKCDLDALLVVCMKDLLNYKVTLRSVGAVKTRRQIARILTQLNAL